MQNDLISRSELIEKMTEVYRKHYAGDVSASGFTIAMEMVRNQPTAYDVEKVVSELEARRKEYEEISENDSLELPQETYYKGLMRGFEYSQDYVRNGGKE